MPNDFANPPPLTVVVVASILSVAELAENNGRSLRKTSIFGANGLLLRAATCLISYRLSLPRMEGGRGEVESPFLSRLGVWRGERPFGARECARSWGEDGVGSSASSCHSIPPHLPENSTGQRQTARKGEHLRRYPH